MKITTSQKIKTGAFIAIAFIVLVLGIFFIGKKQNLFSNNFTVYADFKNVSGLMAGNLVRFGGINVGTVDEISIINDTTIRVGLVVQKSVKPYIKTDSKASIGSDGLMGDKLILLSSGSPAAPLVKDEGSVVAVNPLDMDGVITKFGNIATHAEVITGSLANIFTKVNNGEGSLGRLLNDEAIADNLQKTLESTNKTVKTIDKAADGFSENMEAAKHNFLFRGYFRKKEKQRIKDSIEQAKKASKADVQDKKKQ